jgi:phenylalanyl-tRNA synthetase beta chain
VEAGGAPPRRRLSIRPDRAARLLGLPVSASDVVGSLAQVAITAETRDGAVEIEVPSWRVDLEREVDLIEEVIRVQGYDRVGETRPAVRQAGSIPVTAVARRRIRAAMVHGGLRETRSYPFVSIDDLELLGHDVASAVPVRNPLQSDEGYLRPSLLPGLFRAIGLNATHQVRTVALFEVGHVFRLGTGGEPAVDEREHVAAVFAGIAGTGLRAEGRPFDFFDAKGAVEALMETFAIEGWDLTRAEPDAVTSDAPVYLHPTRAANVSIDGATVGIVGELAPRLAERIDAGGPVAVFELDAGALRSTAGPLTFRLPPRLPPVRRDLAFVVDASVAVGRIAAGIEVAGAPLVEPGSVELFDVFEGVPVPEGKKNVAFSVVFRAPDRTLTDPEVTEAVGRIAEWVRANAGGELRSG